MSISRPSRTTTPRLASSSLGSARAAGDSQHFASIFRTADLFGALRRGDQSRGFVTGGPLGNAIMLAMLTAPKGVRL